MMWVTGDRELIMISRGKCPDCAMRGFVIGPMGGASLNIECANVACRSRFNVTFFGGNAQLGERIEKQSEGAPIWPSEPTLHH